jgi:hypothetical protein
VEPIGAEARRLRAQCADAAAVSADPDLAGLRRRYLRLLESEPVPSDALRRDIRRDLARSSGSDTRATVIAILLATAAVFAFSYEFARVAPALAGSVGFALDAALLLSIPALAAGETTRWRSAVRTSSRRELDGLLPVL